MATSHKKLIEVALPLDAINKASAYEKMPGIGPHPRGLHHWWARRPLTAARAVIFAQMVDDPSAHPDEFPTEEAQEKERQRLFKMIEELVQWKNTTNESVLAQAQEEIWKSWRTTCAENKDHPRAAELFNPEKLPAFHDPFAGGGSLPLEAQRLGLEAYASDLNPVAVLINKAMIEIPLKFAGRPPVNPEARKDKELFKKTWRGAQGLAEDVRYYGQWMRDEAEKRIGHLYPKVEITADMVKERPDLKPLVGKKLIVVAWIWARTVKSPNPAFAQTDVPLVSSFRLSTKKGKEAWVDLVIRPDKRGYDFKVRVGGNPRLKGTVNRRGGICLMSGTPMPFHYIRTEGQAGRMGTRLMAIVAEGEHQRIYLSPTELMEVVARKAQPTWEPDLEINYHPRDIKTQIYGLTQYGDLFTSRQLVVLTTFSDLVSEARERIRHEAVSAGLPDDGKPLRDGGTGALAYCEALALFLAFGLSRLTNFNNSLTVWAPTNEKVMFLFNRQAVPMVWFYGEANPLESVVGGLVTCIQYIASCIAQTVACGPPGVAFQADAVTQDLSSGKVVSTDPPYYDNIGYADLSDFFYVWLRPSLQPVFPDLFATLSVPKTQELVATPYRHGSKEKAEKFFLDGMTQAMQRLAEQAHPAFPVTIYYAFKQSETDDDKGVGSTGWETFLNAVLEAGYTIVGTWPVRSEMTMALKANMNALASSIVLVCRPCPQDAPTATRREFLAALKRELPEALVHLQRANIAPVDLAQSAIGPGMSVFTRYERVLDAAGNAMRVREALTLINQTLDEVLAEQEGDFDGDSRWALSWFEQFGFEKGEYGIAETLSKAKNTSVAGMVNAGVAASKSGKVRLLKPDELPDSWDPATDTRLTVWETVHHLVRALEQGETAAAELVAKLGTKADIVRELAYRLYTLCERKKRATEALSYNGLVQSWPEIVKLAGQKPEPTQKELF